MYYSYYIIMLVQNGQMYQIFKLANETLSFKDEETF